MIFYAWLYALIVFLLYEFDNSKKEKDIIFFTFLSFLLLVFFSTYRGYIGSDIGTYEEKFTMLFTSSKTLVEIFSSTFEPFFNLLIYIFYILNLDFTFFKFLTSFFLIFSVFCFGLKSKSLLITFIVFFPYTYLAIHMGFIRMSYSIGFVFLSLVYLFDKKIIQSIILVSIAPFFHKSFLLITLFLYFAVLFDFFFKSSKFNSTKNKILFFLILFLFIIYFAFTLNYFNHYLSYIYSIYITNPPSNHTESGSFVRVIMNLLPIYFYIKFYNFFKNIKYVNYFILFSIIFIFILTFVNIFGFADNLVNRLSATFSIFQIILLSLTYNFIDKSNKKFFTLSVFVYYFIYLTIWINFSQHAGSWSPYKMNFNLY